MNILPPSFMGKNDSDNRARIILADNSSAVADSIHTM